MYRTVFWLCALCAMTWLLSAAMPRKHAPHIDTAAKSSDPDQASKPEVAAKQIDKKKSPAVVNEPTPASRPVTPNPNATPPAPVATDAEKRKRLETILKKDPDQLEPNNVPQLPEDDEFADYEESPNIKLVRDPLPKAPVNLLDPSKKNPLRTDEENKEPEELDPRMEELKRRMGSTLEFYRKWPVKTSNRSPWEVMHAAIAFGCLSELTRDADDRKVTALGHLCFNGVCEGDSMFRVVGNELVPRRGPGLQGHDGQMLAILAQSKVKIDYPIRAYGRKFTVEDLVEYEKRTVKSGTELTFQLIGLVHYLRGAEEKWENGEGEEWTIRRMLKEEIGSPIRGAACGGTHRLMGISYAYKKRIKRGFPITGQYKRARKYIEDYHRYTFRLQNPDGSFSTQWFNGRGSDRDLAVRVRTTGHIFEWLAFSLTDEQLREDKMVAAAEYLTGMLSGNRHRDWKIGPLGHALHGLRIYQERVFTNKRPPEEPELAKPTRRPDRTALLPKKDGDKPSKPEASVPKKR